MAFLFIACGRKKRKWDRIRGMDDAIRRGLTLSSNPLLIQTHDASWHQGIPRCVMIESITKTLGKELMGNVKIKDQKGRKAIGQCVLAKEETDREESLCFLPKAYHGGNETWYECLLKKFNYLRYFCHNATISR